MATGARVSVFGSFALQLASGKNAAFRTRKAAEVVARLTLQEPKRISRPSLAQEIWPEAPETGRLNNLRPALVYIKASFGNQDALQIDGDQLQLDNSVESDWKEAARMERRSRSGENDLDRLSSLLALESLLSPGLLDEWNASWIEPFRVQHQNRRLQTLLQIAQAFDETDQFDASLEYSNRAMNLDPLSEKAITQRLKVLSKLGKTETAQTDYRRYVKMLKSEFGMEPSSNLHKFALDVIKGRTSLTQLPNSTERQKEFVAHLLEVTLKSAPERLLPLFAAQEMNWTVMIHDREMLPILEGILEATRGWSEDRRGVTKRLLALCYHHGDFEKMGYWAGLMHEGIPAEDLDQIAMHVYLAGAAQAKEDHSTSYKLMDRALELAKLHKDDYLISVVEANMALNLAMNGKYDEGEEILRRSLPGLEASTTPNGRFSLALAYQGLMSIYLYRGDYDKAVEMGRRWKDIVDVYAVGQVESGARTIFGIALLLDGDTSGQQIILEGLDLAQRQRRPKIRHLNIVMAAVALALLGEKGKAERTARWIFKKRLGSIFPMTAAERDLLQRFTGESDVSDKPSGLESASSSEIVEWLYEQIAAANP